MNISEAEFVKWDFEDQGLGSELVSPETPTEEDDDVFLSREEATSETRVIAPRKSPIDKVEKKRASLRWPSCCAQWSVSHRCLDCIWKERRGGRPHHPPPPISPLGITSSSPLVTLQSLGTTRDSGYEPSPTSAFSFSFASDDDEDYDDVEREDAVCDDPKSSAGVTPPINIPSPAGILRGRIRARVQRVPSPSSSPLTEPIKEDVPSRDLRDAQSPMYTSAPPLRRTKSEPELWASERILSPTPIMLRSGQTQHGSPLTPVHGRNYSLPATTPDGKPLFSPTPVASASRSSRERLIDLAEGDPDGRHGHNRRVLVLALPDLLVDLETLKREGSSTLSSSSSPQSPSIKSCYSSTSSTDAFSSPCPKFTPTRPWPPAMATLSAPSTPSNDSSDVIESYPRAGCHRPTWRRPRAISCDVTLEVEFGQELRRAADDFTRTYSAGARGIWRTLRNGLERRFSFDATTQLCLNEPDDSANERGSHSLPANSSCHLYQ